MIRALLWLSLTTKEDVMSQRYDEELKIYQNKLYTVKAAAEIIGVQYRALLEGVNKGRVPYYRMGRSRRLVNILEVTAQMKAEAKNV